MTEAIILTPLTSPEVPAIIRDLCQPAHMNLTEGELRKSIVEKRVYKATKGQIPFGVVTLTPKPLTEMAVWLSEKESRETWAEAIKKAILQAFSAPEVYRVRWSILASCKNMLIVAEGCGFKSLGEFPEEGPNRELVIAFGLSRNGSSPNESLQSRQSSLAIEKEKLIKDGLERKILSLEAELNTAKQEIKNREKLLSEENTKRIQAENNLLLLEEKVAESDRGAGLNIDERLAEKIKKMEEMEEKIESLKKEAINANKEKEKYREWLETKNKALKEATGKISRLEEGLEKTKVIHCPQPVGKTDESETAELENLIATKLQEKAIKRNENRIAKLAAVMNFIWQAQETTITPSVLKDHFDCSNQTPVNWTKDLKSIGMVVITFEQVKGKGVKQMIIRAAIPALMTVDKPETKLKSEKPEAKPESELEISQKVELALESLRKPEVSLTKGLSLKELGVEPEEAEKFVEAVQATNLCHIIGSPKDPENCFIRLKKITLANAGGGSTGGKKELTPAAIVKIQEQKEETVIPIGEFLNGERERLNACFSSQSKFVKAKGEISEALKSGKLIKAENFGSQCGIKKSEISTVIALLCKEINNEAQNKFGKLVIKEIILHGEDDYENTTIEIKAFSGMPEEEKGSETGKPVTAETRKIEEKSTRGASEKILAKLSQTHREIFYTIEKAGGSSTKAAIKNEVGISMEVCELCINALVENGLVTIELEKVSLSNMV